MVAIGDQHLNISPLTIRAPHRRTKGPNSGHVVNPRKVCKIDHKYVGLVIGKVGSKRRWTYFASLFQTVQRLEL